MNTIRHHAVAVAALVLALGPAGIFAQTADPHLLELPMLIAACDRDPGDRLTPGGGRYDPDQVMEDFDCTPVEDVSVTVYNRDIDFFARCETDEEGLCRVEAPTDPERELMVALHMSTVPPGLSPEEVITPTVHFSEFTGTGIVLMSDREETGGTPAAEERRTLAVKVEQDGDPAEVLTQLSEGDVSIENFPWLATNDDGWVSYDLGLFETDTIDLMIDVDVEPAITCRDIDNDVPVTTEWIEGREGDFARISLPDTNGDINCDITLP